MLFQLSGFGASNDPDYNRRRLVLGLGHAQLLITVLNTLACRPRQTGE